MARAPVAHKRRTQEKATLRRLTTSGARKERSRALWGLRPLLARRSSGGDGGAHVIVSVPQRLQTATAAHSAGSPGGGGGGEVSHEVAD